MISLFDFATIVPELFLVGTALMLLLVGVFRGDKATTSLTYTAVLACALVFALLMFGDRNASRTAFNGLFRADEFARVMKLLVMIGSASALILGLDYFKRNQLNRFELPVLVLLASSGMFVMISAADLITLYVGLELQSLCLYVVASFDRDNARSTEAGLKYFVLGALSSGMLLYGASLIYGFTGNTHFADIARVLQATGSPPIGVIFGLVFVIAGIAFKVSAVPFHMWTPDVYEGSPTPVTAFFAAAPKVAAIALFVRFLAGPFGGAVGQWQQIVVFVSIASMLLGSLAAINQTNIKRLIAYSSIGHMGYALIGLASHNQAGISAVIIYMAIYIAMSLGTFGCILAMRVGGRQVERIEDLAGLSKTHPLTALALAVFMFSMAGIPPLAGFFSKLYIFLAAIDAKLYALAVIGVLTSVIGAYYYLRIVKLMYFDEPRLSFEGMDRPVAFVTSLSAVSMVLFFLVTNPLVAGAQHAAASLIP